MTTIAEIRQLVSQSGIQPSTDNSLYEGSIVNSKNESVTYNIFHGWDITRANLCDQNWGCFNLDLIHFIRSQSYDPDELQEVMEKIQLDDNHWDWLAKSCLHRSDEYDWFYLDIGNRTEAICLIYHPKDSVIDSQDIFYIEYLAVAPWNRANPMAAKEYDRLGSLLLKYVIDFAKTNLGLRHGFCLHSLPKAKGFYKHIGMIEYDQYKKGSLSYFEMSEHVAQSYLEVAS